MPALLGLPAPIGSESALQPRFYNSDISPVASSSRRQLNAIPDVARLEGRRWAPAPNGPASQAAAVVGRENVVADSSGHFNGSCKMGPQTASGDTLPPNAGQEACVSFIPDVTSYCCLAVGGTEVNVTSTAPTSDNAASEQIYAPECRTTNYTDMLECYMVTVEDHCARESIGPFGFCNRGAAADTSYSINHSSSAAPSFGARRGRRRRRTGTRMDKSVAGRCKALIQDPVMLTFLLTTLTSAAAFLV